MKYSELKKLVTITGEKTPTYKSIRESQTPIVFQLTRNNVIITVYQNGFVTYSVIEGNTERTTVFSLSKVHCTYRFVDGTVVTIPKSEYEQFDAAIVLSTYGEERLEYNNHSRQELTKDKQKKVQQSYNPIVSDFSDDIIKKLDIDSPVLLALKNLTDKQRTVIHLYYWEDLNQREIAEYLGISRSSVQSRYDNAIKKLNKIMKK